MSWNRDHIEDASAEVDVTDVHRPICNPEGFLNLRYCGGDELNVRPAFELRITSRVVAVCVRMHHHERNGTLVIASSPSRDDIRYDGRRLHLAGTGIFK